MGEIAAIFAMSKPHFLKPSSGNAKCPAVAICDKAAELSTRRLLAVHHLARKIGAWLGVD
jgi:hypothetical protein